MQPDLQQKATSITYSERVFVILGIQLAMRMRHIVVFGLSSRRKFFRIVTNGTIFEKKKLLNIKCVLIFFLYNVRLKDFYF